MAPAGLDGAKVLVLGLGRFSGGVETVRHLRREGAEVLVSDAAPRETLEDSAREVEALGARLAFGVQTPSLLEGRDLVVANPAIPFDHPVLVAAAERGMRITTEVNLFFAAVRAPVFGVTGTKGKSTTATLLAAMLREAGRTVHLGGNVGRALVAEAGRIDPQDVVVLELSSFQLHWLRRAGRSPALSLVTNLFGDHLDRHGSLEAYAVAKRAILDFQTEDDLAVLPADDADVEGAGFLRAGRARRVLYGRGGDVDLSGETIVGPDGLAIPLAGLRLPGAHNRRNALAAAAAALAAGATADAVAAGAGTVDPLPHRLAPVDEVGGVLWVDDSNGTNPTSTLFALRASHRPTIVLIGGKSKGLDLGLLIEGLAKGAKAVVGIGTTGPDVVRRLGDRMPTAVAKDMDDAVAKACALAAPGDRVLLSPAFSSLDEYPSFVERGRRFQAAVKALHTPGKGAPDVVG